MSRVEGLFLPNPFFQTPSLIKVVSSKTHMLHSVILAGLDKNVLKFWILHGYVSSFLIKWLFFHLIFVSRTDAMTFGKQLILSYRFAVNHGVEKDNPAVHQTLLKCIILKKLLLF